MKKLVLVRHGNTFESHEIPRFVGRNEDLELTSYGREQIAKVVSHMKKNGIVPDKIYAAPLLRTKAAAEILRDELLPNGQIKIDSRLLEISHGKWAGLTDAEVISRFGKTEIDNFHNNVEWPVSADFKPSKNEVISETREFLESLENGTTFAVSSNARIRWYGKPETIFSDVPEPGPTVLTGAFCILEFKDHHWKVVQWNVRPE